MHERRQLKRTKVQAAARVILNGRPGFDCIVRDLTSSGAGIEMAHAPADRLQDFDLKFDGARSLRHCRLVWRISNRMGVKFIGHE